MGGNPAAGIGAASQVQLLQLGQGPKQIAHLLDQRRHIHGTPGQMQLAPFAQRHVAHVVDEAVQCVGRVAQLAHGRLIQRYRTVLPRLEAPGRGGPPIPWRSCRLDWRVARLTRRNLSGCAIS